jgi:HSP20 family protein
MFFAPTTTNTAVTAPNRSTSELGLQRFMRDVFGGLTPVAYEIDEDEKSWTLRIDVPGVPRNQLLVQIDGKTVRIESDKDCPRKISALYEPPAQIDVDKTEAHLQDGVLTLKLAKAESAMARRIEVH